MKNLTILSKLEEAMELSRDQTGQSLEAVMVNNKIGIALFNTSSEHWTSRNGDYYLFGLKISLDRFNKFNIKDDEFRFYSTDPKNTQYYNVYHY